MDSLTKISAEQFAKELASKTSVPGGGSVAAYVGALSAALASMVCNFTLGKPKYAQYESEIESILKKAEEYRVHLLMLVNEDAKMFGPLSKAYAISKDDPARPEIIERETKSAIKPPLTMMQDIACIISLLGDLEDKGSRLLISDIGCSALLAQASIQCAAMNVFINISALQDKDYANRIKEECSGLLKSVEVASKIANKVFAAIDC